MFLLKNQSLIILTQISNSSSTIIAKSGYVTKDEENLVLLNGYIHKKENNSDLILINAIKGMLPSNKLSNQLIKHLKVYRDNNHPHSSQSPKILEI